MRRHLKNFGCLSLVPETHVVNVFEKIQSEIPDSLSGNSKKKISPLTIFSVTDFADYIEDNYVGRPIRGNRRRCPRFSISMWNCFKRLDQQLPRSNNSVEAWNKAIKVELIFNVVVIYPNRSHFSELCSRKSISIRKYQGPPSRTTCKFDPGRTSTFWSG